MCKETRGKEHPHPGSPTRLQRTIPPAFLLLNKVCLGTCPRRAFCSAFLWALVIRHSYLCVDLCAGHFDFKINPCRAWGEGNPKNIWFIQQYLYQKAECTSVEIWNLHWRLSHWLLIPAICSGCQFRRTPESVNTKRTSWSGPSVDTLTPTMTLVHFPHLVVTSRCTSDYALLCWNTMQLIVDLKCSGLMVEEDFYTNPACYFWISVLLHGTFLASSNYLQFLEVSMVSQSFLPIFCPWNVCVPC